MGRCGATQLPRAGAPRRGSRAALRALIPRGPPSVGRVSALSSRQGGAWEGAEARVSPQGSQSPHLLVAPWATRRVRSRARGVEASGRRGRGGPEGRDEADGSPRGRAQGARPRAWRGGHSRRSGRPRGRWGALGRPRRKMTPSRPSCRPTRRLEVVGLRLRLGVRRVSSCAAISSLAAGRLRRT